MTPNHMLRGRLQGFKVKPRDEETVIDVTLSIPLQQDNGPVDLAGLGEMAGQQVIVEIQSLQPRLPLKKPDTDG